MKRHPHPGHFRFSPVANLDGVELLHVAGVTYEYPPHLHEEYAVGVMLGGTETMHIGATTYTARRGSVLLINAEELHSNVSVRSEYKVIKIGPSLLEEHVSFPHPVINERRHFDRLLDLYEMLEGTASHAEKISSVVRAIAHLVGAFTCGRHSIIAVRDYLKSHFNENVSLHELASMSGVSPFHLLRLFRHQFGVSPHEYLTQLRVSHVRKLIRAGQSITQAALQAGFFDQSHLSRNFRRIVGMTPGQYESESKIVQDRAS